MGLRCTNTLVLSTPGSHWFNFCAEIMKSIFAIACHVGVLVDNNGLIALKTMFKGNPMQS